MTNLQGIVQEKCPKCKKGNIFEYRGNIFLFKAPKMHSHCPECGYRFEKEPGYFLGSMYVSYALAIAELVAIFISLVFFMDTYIMMLLMLLGLILMSFFNFRTARTVWIYIFQY